MGPGVRIVGFEGLGPGLWDRWDRRARTGIPARVLGDNDGAGVGGGGGDGWRLPRPHTVDQRRPLAGDVEKGDQARRNCFFVSLCPRKVGRLREGASGSSGPAAPLRPRDGCPLPRPNPSVVACGLLLTPFQHSLSPRSFLLLADAVPASLDRRRAPASGCSERHLMRCAVDGIVCLSTFSW